MEQSGAPPSDDDAGAARGTGEGVDPDAALVAEISALLGRRSVATAESCTAGRVAAAIASAEGAADFFRGGLVAYQVPVKQELLGVSTTKVLNQRTAEEMAVGAARLLHATAAVATTGVAGGEPIDGVPAGTVFIGTAVDGRRSSARHWFPGEPEEVCAAAASQALRDLAAALRDATRTADAGAAAGEGRSAQGCPSTDSRRRSELDG
jgi:PncC family amidohydrolase